MACAGHVLIVRGLPRQPAGGEEGPFQRRRRPDQYGGHRTGSGYSFVLAELLLPPLHLSSPSTSASSFWLLLDLGVHHFFLR